MPVRTRHLALVLLAAAGTILLVSGTGEATHLRPKFAKPIRESLVPQARQCASPNMVHGPGLSLPSCNPPVNVPSPLTIGTPDVNALGANSNSFVRLDMLIPPATGAPDMPIRVNVDDVYCNPPLAPPTCVNTGEALDDYIGGINLQLGFRLSDHCNGPAPAGGCTNPGTMVDLPLDVKVACSSVGPGQPGGACVLGTTLNSIIPGAVVATKRQVYEVMTLNVQDGGADGDPTTTPNSTFLVRGLFQP
jgi:hypothetical protein